MHKLFAHAEELHTTSTSDLEHTLTQPIVALPLFLGVLLALVLVLRFGLKMPVRHILIISLGLFFVIGVTTYSLVPLVSIVSLSAGIGLALIFSLASIAK